MDIKTKYTNCRHNFGRTMQYSQVLRFGGTKYIFNGERLAFITCLKQVSLSTTKFGVAQKDWG